MSNTNTTALTKSPTRAESAPAGRFMIPEKTMAGMVVAARKSIVRAAGSCALLKRFQIKPRDARYSVTISAMAMTPGSQVVSWSSWREAASIRNAPAAVAAHVPTIRQSVSCPAKMTPAAPKHAASPRAQNTIRSRTFR
jgi:hypothetical protein